jgi:hypothetical protein
LVVIAIIAILAGMLLPILARTKAKTNQAYCLNSMKQIGLAVGLYTLDNRERFPLCRNWGRAWGNDHALRNDNVWLPELLQPYLGKNMAKPTNTTPGKVLRPAKGIFSCPTGLASRDPAVSWLRDFLVDNDHVTYVWNHIYLNKARTAYENDKPVSGRPTHRVVNATKAVLAWEIPYWDYKYMPHKRGINLVYADNHAAWFKGSPKEEDWWAYHSRDGWEPD